VKNLLLVAHNFPPAAGPAVQRPAKFAKYLPEFGYRPLVLASGAPRNKHAPDQSLLDGLQQTEVVSCYGRERYLPLLQRAGLGFLAKFCLLPDREVLWVPAALRAATELAKQRPLHAIFTTVRPWSCVLLGQQLKKTLGIPWVLDYRDPWTTGNTSWPTPLHRWHDVRQEREAVRAADAIVVVTPTMKELLVKAFPEARGKVHVICNGYDGEDFIDLTPAPPPDRLRIGYTGGLVDYDPFWGGLAALRAKLLRPRTSSDWSTHSPFYLLRAVRALLDERPEWNDRIELCFAGGFGKANRRHVERLGLGHVVSVQGYLAHDRSVRLLMDCDVLFLPMVSPCDGQRSYNLSGKVFEYLAAGKPILAAVPEGDARDLIRRARAGWCVDPRDVESLRNHLRALVEQKLSGSTGSAPDREYVARFERRELTRQLAALLDSLTAAPPGASPPHHCLPRKRTAGRR
jgi:glycosyltransferase involved in cell wall biosynthesis